MVFFQGYLIGLFANQYKKNMATKITAAKASSIFQRYHGNPAQPKLKNSNGDVIQGFIIDDTDYQRLKAVAGANFDGIMAVPGHNADGDDTLILVGLRKVSGKYELVLPPNKTDDSFIMDFVTGVPPMSPNSNFANLQMPNWGC
jgi:hypothetical protein